MQFPKNFFCYFKVILFLGSSCIILSTYAQVQTIRVLLATHQLPLKEPCFFTTAGTQYELLSAKKKQKLLPNQLCLTVKRDHIVVQGNNYGSALELRSDGNLSYNGKAYHGTLLIRIFEKKLMIINCVPLEQYICSVLKTESWPGWPLEVNKAFAVTSRTYALYMAAEAKRTGRLYDVHNCKKHQTYSGVHDTKILHDAVMQTKGMIITYQGKPILAMFDSCCGGVIPARMHDVNFNDAPYLARTYACRHCKPLWIYSWKAALTTQELADRLFSDQQHKPVIKSIRITKKDPAGLIQELEINARKKISLSGKELYNSLPEVKSFAYTLKQEKDTLHFSGRGYGHHIGLCQWGAREMVREGWHYKRILQFYYPGTRLARVKV